MKCSPGISKVEAPNQKRKFGLVIFTGVHSTVCTEELFNKGFNVILQRRQNIYYFMEDWERVCGRGVIVNSAHCMREKSSHENYKMVFRIHYFLENLKGKIIIKEYGNSINSFLGLVERKKLWCWEWNNLGLEKLE